MLTDTKKKAIYNAAYKKSYGKNHDTLYWELFSEYGLRRYENSSLTNNEVAQEQAEEDFEAHVKAILEERFDEDEEVQAEIKELAKARATKDAEYAVAEADKRS